MARSAKKIGDDLTRSFKRILRHERDLQYAHAEGDFEKAWREAVALKANIAISARLMSDFLAAVRLPGIKAGNPGSQDEGESDG